MAQRKQRGTVTIEVALGFFAFWLMVMAWAELSYMSYISAINDIAVTEASRSAKKDSAAYLEAFYQRLQATDTIWSDFLDKDKFRASVRYVKDIEALKQVNQVCYPAQGAQTAECGVAKDSAIAIYYIGYELDTMFSYFVDGNELFGREVIVVQEYERDAFKF